MRRAVPWVLASAGVLAIAGCAGMFGPSNPMTFFVTSVGSGRGGDLGGVAGADRHCQELAATAEGGAGRRTWRAYVSAPAGAGGPVNARDRIGSGPWMNAKGVMVARNLAELHGENNINKETGLDEHGNRINVRGDTPNQHDIMTGSNMDGTLSTQVPDTTCHGWTSSNEGAAMVGHLDRTGTNPDPVRNVSWNSSHATPGCSTEALAKVGGGGLLYCFAPN